MSKNIVRDISNLIHENLNLIIGNYYVIIHFVIGFLGLFVLLFSTSLAHLSILFLITSMDALAIVVLHDCPLTMLEQKYLTNSSVKYRNKLVKSAKIVYKCNHLYESQIELLVNAWCFVAIKMLCIIIIRFFNIGGNI